MLTIHLDASARKAIAHLHDRFSAVETIAETVKGHRVSLSRVVRFTPAHHHRR